MAIKLITINLHQYTIKKQPNYLSLGLKVDKVITNHFSEGEYLIRAVGLEGHPNLSLDKLVSIILETGTDKYNPNKKSVAHEEFANYDYDIQATKFEIKNSTIKTNDSDEIPSLFGQIIYDFYNHAPYDRGYPVRIDLLILYNPQKLTKAKKINPNGKQVNKKLEKYLYKFKGNKKDALVGIIKVL